MNIEIPKEKGFLYDDAEVHWPSAKQKGCKSFEEATFHFKVLLKWLDDNGLLVEEAKKYIQLEVLPKKFELRSWMITELGNKVIPPVYDKWIKKIKYGDKSINMSLLDKALKDSQEEK